MEGHVNVPRKGIADYLSRLSGKAGRWPYNCLYYTARAGKTIHLLGGGSFLSEKDRIYRGGVSNPSVMDTMSEVEGYLIWDHQTNKIVAHKNGFRVLILLSVQVPHNEHEADLADVAGVEGMPR